MALAAHFCAAEKGFAPLLLRVALALEAHKLERGIQVQWFPPDALRLAKERVRQGQHRLPQVVRPLVGQVKALNFWSVVLVAVHHAGVKRRAVFLNVWVKLGGKHEQEIARKRGTAPWKRAYKVLELKPHAVRLDVSGVDLLPWQSLRKVSLAAPYFHDENIPLPNIDPSDRILVTPREPDVAPPPVDRDYDDTNPWNNWDERRRYEIDRVLATKRQGSGWSVQIKWTGLTDPTWIPSSNLPDHPELQEQFER